MTPAPKKPTGTGSNGPQGPKTPSATLYPPNGGASTVSPKGDTSDPWRPTLQGQPQGAVNATGGSPPVKEGKLAEGNVSTNRKHENIKATGSDEAMRKTESVTSTTALKKGKSKGARVYPKMNSAFKDSEY